MKVSQSDLRRAAASSGLSEEHADALWRSLQSISRDDGRPTFDLANVAYLFGALIVIGAMGWFMTEAWEGLGGLGIAAVATAYAVCFIVVGRLVWAKPNLRIPGGLLFTIAVCMVPLITYGIERWLGFWPENDPGAYTKFHPYINGSWVVMEIATTIAGLIALCFWRFPFLTAPIAYALWYMSMDLAALIGGHEMSWSEKAAISTAFGAIVIVWAYVTDLLGKGSDFAFWGYLFGLMSFWGGLSATESSSEIGKLVYCFINLALILIAVILRRPVFMIFGAFGICGYLGHLAHSVFQNSILFPVALSAIGLGIIFLGVQYQRRRTAIEKSVRDRIIPYIRDFIPERALED